MPYQKITNTKVLVTGGAGFIGSNLCEDLLENKPGFIRVSTQSIMASKKFRTILSFNFFKLSNFKSINKLMNLGSTTAIKINRAYVV